jgi:hypothetical protein
MGMKVVNNGTMQLVGKYVKEHDGRWTELLSWG